MVFYENREKGKKMKEQSKDWRSGAKDIAVLKAFSFFFPLSSLL